MKLIKTGRVLDSVNIGDLSYSKFKLNLLLGEQFIKFVVTPRAGKSDNYIITLSIVTMFMLFGILLNLHHISQL